MHLHNKLMCLQLSDLIFARKVGNSPIHLNTFSNTPAYYAKTKNYSRENYIVHAASRTGMTQKLHFLDTGHSSRRKTEGDAGSDGQRIRYKRLS